VKELTWTCSVCERNCVPIRAESRCLCGHRLKDHCGGDAATPFKCKNARCSCPHFFLIVAEGSWILRCRCKHRHTDHDPRTRECCKGSCGCRAFDSPWVCNCDHPWSAHHQIVVERDVVTIAARMAGSDGAGSWHAATEIEVAPDQFVPEVNRFDLLKRGI